MLESSTQWMIAVHCKGKCHCSCLLLLFLIIIIITLYSKHSSPLHSSQSPPHLPFYPDLFLFFFLKKIAGLPGISTDNAYMLK